MSSKEKKESTKETEMPKEENTTRTYTDGFYYTLAFADIEKREEFKFSEKDERDKFGLRCEVTMSATCRLVLIRRQSRKLAVNDGVTK